MKQYEYAMIDIDNSICQTNEQIQLKIKDFNESVYPYPLPLNFFEDNPDVFLVAAPCRGAAEKLTEFVSLGNRIAYVTAREPWTRTITNYWLKKHNFPLAPVLFTQDKREVALRYNFTFGIDDAPHELSRLIDLMPFFVPARGYNEGFTGRFEDWCSLDLCTEKVCVI
ncbi:LNS2 domain-containing protein [Paenibacillus taichungensis]